MKRRHFTILCYLIALLVMLLMIAPEATARFSEFSLMVRVNGGLPAPAAESVDVTPTPEPSRGLLLIIGSASILMRLRR